MLVLLVLVALFQAALAGAQQAPPPGFVPPALHPAGVVLRTVPVGDGVYALMASKPPADNAGFVVGANGVLVIDAHINADMAYQIIAAVRAVTDKPILYLVNTNHLADHTFGNYAFPDETQIVAQRESARLMKGFEQQKKGMLGAVRGDQSIFEPVKLRLPDIVFDDYLELDLGDRKIELHHFGAGMTLGDTIVFVPEGRIAWTGNLLFGEGSLPFMLAGRPARYAETLTRFKDELDVALIVPGHGITTNSSIIDRYVDYLTTLDDFIQSANDANWTLDETLQHATLPERFAIPAGLSSEAFYGGVHPFNVQRVYLERQAEGQ
jgi:cyclase